MLPVGTELRIFFISDEISRFPLESNPGGIPRMYFGFEVGDYSKVFVLTVESTLQLPAPIPTNLAQWKIAAYNTISSIYNSEDPDSLDAGNTALLAAFQDLYALIQD